MGRFVMLSAVGKHVGPWMRPRDDEEAFRVTGKDSVQIHFENRDGAAGYRQMEPGEHQFDFASVSRFRVVKICGQSATSVQVIRCTQLT